MTKQERRYIVCTAVKGKHDEKGKEGFQQSKRDLESAGFRITKVETLPSGRNIIIYSVRA